MSLSGIGGFGPLGGLPSATGGNAPGKLEKSPVEEFLEYARKSPAERMRAAVLEEMDLSEEKLKTMPAEQRELMEKMIAERLKEKIEQAAEKRTGMIVDVQA